MIHEVVVLCGRRPRSVTFSLPATRVQGKLSEPVHALPELTAAQRLQLLHAVKNHVLTQEEAWQLGDAVVQALQDKDLDRVATLMLRVAVSPDAETNARTRAASVHVKTYPKVS